MPTLKYERRQTGSRVLHADAEYGDTILEVRLDVKEVRRRRFEYWAIKKEIALVYVIKVAKKLVEIGQAVRKICAKKAYVSQVGGRHFLYGRHVVFIIRWLRNVLQIILMKTL